MIRCDSLQWGIWITALMVEGLHLACRPKWSRCLMQREREIWISWEGSYTFLITAEHISAWIFPWIITGHVMMVSTTLCWQPQRQGCERASRHAFRCSEVDFLLLGWHVLSVGQPAGGSVIFVRTELFDGLPSKLPYWFRLSSDFSLSASMGFSIYAFEWNVSTSVEGIDMKLSKDVSLDALLRHTLVLLYQNIRTADSW